MHTVIPADLQAILLDIDGTLIDSNDAHTHAWLDCLKEAGFPVTFATIRPLIGMGGDKILPAVTSLSSGSAQGQKISRRRGEIFRQNYLPKLRPFNGTRELIEAFQNEGIELGIASSASKKDLGKLLDQAGVADLLKENRTSSDDALSSKPSPDIVLAALKKIDRDPAKVLMIGDTPYDVEAARRAGIHVVAFRCGGHWHDKDFSGASAVYDDPNDLLNHWQEGAGLRAAARTDSTAT